MSLLKLIIFTSLIAFLFILSEVLAQESANDKRDDPYKCIDYVQNKDKEKINGEMLKCSDACSSCVMAELKKRAGDYEAARYYEEAIKADETEPAYELFYADYLRNFRGAQRPLFPEAEEHYYEALRKFIKLKQANKLQEFDIETKNRVERGLITLYQEDGVPLLYRETNIDDSGKIIERPSIFFGTINKYAKSTSDFDEVDDVRDFTSEAHFSESEKRLNRLLTEDEMRGIIRTKEQFETLNRIRFRYKELPAFDILYKYREIEDAQITNFFEPNKFNDVKLNEYGFAFEKPFNISPAFDFFVRGTFKKVVREGIIEFLSEEKEDINHYEVKTIISRFFGPDKANLELNYVFQDINPDIPNPPKRDRRILGATLTVLRPLYELHFETRGLELYGGLVYDKERHDDVEVKKNNYFVGASLKGHSFDFTIQPTIFNSSVSDDESQDNSQYRTDVTLLYRIINEEDEPGIPDKFLGIYPAFLHLVVPMRHDVAIDGFNDFENFKAGIELSTKYFAKSSQETKLSGTTFLASVRYDYQRFFRLDKSLNLVGVNISMGF